MKVQGAQKKFIPDDEKRLKIIKQSLLAIGNRITVDLHNAPNATGMPKLEDQLWEYISNRHWPQSAKENKRVSGTKLRDMYVKIAGKDKAKDGDKKPAPVPQRSGSAATNGTSAVKAEPKPTPSPAPVAEAKRESPAPVKKDNAMEVDAKPTV